MWGVPLSMLIVFALKWHESELRLIFSIPQWIVLVACLILLVQAVRHLRAHPVRIVCVALAIALVLVISLVVVGRTPEGEPIHLTLAWPWHFPIGTAMTLGLGYLVGNKRP